MTILYTIRLAIVATLFGFADMFVQNQIALGQMEISSLALISTIGLEGYRLVKSWTFFLMWVIFTLIVIRETHKHLKTKEQNEK